MKFIILLLAFGQVKADQAYDEAATFVNATSFQWNQSSIQFQTQAILAFGEIVNTSDILGASFLKLGEQLGSPRAMNFTKDTTTSFLGQIHTYLVPAHVTAFLYRTNADFQTILNGLLEFIAAIGSLPKLATCWDASKTNVQGAITKQFAMRFILKSAFRHVYHFLVCNARIFKFLFTITIWPYDPI